MTKVKETPVTKHRAQGHTCVEVGPVAGDMAATANIDLVCIEMGKSAPAENLISRLLTGNDVKTVKLIRMVREGLPVSSFERVKKRMGGVHTDTLLPIIGMSPRTYSRRKETKQALTPTESDRLYRLAKIEFFAEAVFGDQITATDLAAKP